MWLQNCEIGHQNDPSSRNGPRAAASFLARRNLQGLQTAMDRDASVSLGEEEQFASHRFQRLATVVSDAIGFLNPRRLMQGARNNQLLYRPPWCKQSTAERFWNTVLHERWDVGWRRTGLRNGLRKETEPAERSQKEYQCFSFRDINDSRYLTGISLQERFELLKAGGPTRSGKGFSMDNDDTPSPKAGVSVHFCDEILFSMGHKTFLLK